MVFYQDVQKARIAVVGLGYVGLPLAVEFAKIYPVVGFDINQDRIKTLRSGRDSTLEVTDGELAEARRLRYSYDVLDIADCNVFIVTVPTPIDTHRRPDLLPLINASKSIAELLKPGDVVIYESTVYPGATEEDCVPILEQGSGLMFNKDFFVGYSPERINPGDKNHRLSDIIKVTSGSTAEVANFVDSLYGSIILAGTHRAPSIRVAEAAKVIENTQRDINIALMNELAIIFNRLGIDTNSVLKAAGTKWNFLPFRPGLVGGHCIGVDPYYLTHKAEQAGYHPEIILAGRRLNDRMGTYVATQLIKEMLRKRIQVQDARVLVLGLTFKEDCPDLRNTRVIDLINELIEFGVSVDVHDPWADPDEAFREYGVTLVDLSGHDDYDAIVVVVAHQQFSDLGLDALRSLCKPAHVLYDVKHVLPSDESILRL